MAAQRSLGGGASARGGDGGELGNNELHHSTFYPHAAKKHDVLPPSILVMHEAFF